MDPSKIFKEVIVPTYDYERESPARDLAFLRDRERRDYHADRYRDLINKKWRLKYIIIYNKEKNR